MKNNSIYNSMLSGVLLLFLFVVSSCTRRTLDEFSPTGTVNITFDWENLAQGETVPTGMNLIFYGSHGSVITQTSDGTSFSGALPLDTYQVIAYNSDAIGVTYAGLETYSNAQICAMTTKAGLFLTQPKHAYGIGLETLTITSKSNVTVTMAPANFVKQATLNLSVTGHRAGITSCSSTLDGLAQSVSIADGTLLNTAGTVAFIPQATAAGFQENISFFGKSSAATTNSLSTVFNFTGGGNQTIPIDIASSLTGAIPTRFNIYLYINVTGTLPAGSFQATLTNWDVVNRDGTVE